MEDTTEEYDFTGLSMDQRMLITRELLKGTRDEIESRPLTAVQRGEIEHRIAAADAGRIPSFPWSEVERRLEGRR